MFSRVLSAGVILLAGSHVGFADREIDWQYGYLLPPWGTAVVEHEVFTIGIPPITNGLVVTSHLEQETTAGPGPGGTTTVHSIQISSVSATDAGMHASASISQSATMSSGGVITSDTDVVVLVWQSHP